MLKDGLPHERLALVGLAMMVVGGLSYAIVKGQRQPAPIVFQPVVSQPGKAGAATEVVVHATGAVKRPGLLRMSAESRVDDAIRAAGGALPGADLDQINLAAKLVDGTQVYVPTRSGSAESVPDIYRGGSPAEPYVSSSPRPRSAKHSSSGGNPVAGSISLNTASSAQLDSLPGVGPSTAQKILGYRREHGGFSSIDELMAVKGIGPKKLKAMRKYLRL